MKPIRKNSGQTLVEFALILPLFLFLVMALFEIGRAVFYFAVLNNAVREGTRFAIVQLDCDYYSNPATCSGSYTGNKTTATCGTASSAANAAICNEIQNKLFTIGELSNSVITIQHFDNGAAENTEYYVKIDIIFQFEPITPGLNLIGAFPLNVSSQMLKVPLAKPK